MARDPHRRWRTLVLTSAIVFAVASHTRAYSVLAHEANVDALWDSAIRPLIARRYPHITPQELQRARASAYGGSVIQDLGYYPFGSRFFSNLLHYVRTGDFVEEMLRSAKDANELAFAIGALAHYAADNVGHPEAVNRAVPLLFPKLQAKYGDRVTYVQSPVSHVMTEFSFDVVQVAGGGYVPDAYHAFIGFDVQLPLLERAFRSTYGLEMRDVFGEEELALSTYRHAVSELIPKITETAWRDKRKQIEKLTPGIEERNFVFRYTNLDYSSEFPGRYRKPGLFMRFIAFLYRLLPKIGPLRPLAFRAPTPEAERLFGESLHDTRARFADALTAVAEGRLDLANTNFDIGRRSTYGEYALADDTYRELLKRLDRDDARPAPEGLKAAFQTYYAGADDVAARQTRRERKKLQEVRERLTRVGGPSAAGPH
jgi:hypothetical protein